MTDLLQVLPDFDTRPYTHLLPSLDKALITTNDLLTLEPVDVGKRAQLPAGDLRKLVDGIARGLHRRLGFGGEEAHANSFLSALPIDGWGAISTLDEGLDAALGGGIRAGYLTEITGERCAKSSTILCFLSLTTDSGVGKTQLLLTLLLAAQLPAPHGLSRSAVYISTEAALATTRLTQLLSAHHILASLPPKEKPSLSRILSIQTPDLESQDHILRYQLPVAVKKHGIGLVILDSVAANYRAEFERKGARNGAASMAKRGADLVQLGALLRDLARTENIAVVVANQVADRFERVPSAPSSNNASRTTSGNSQPSRENTPHTPQPFTPHGLSLSAPDPSSVAGESAFISPDPLALDHQQRWFTGWGDMQYESSQSLKTPSLGLVWTNQLACRIALIKQPVYTSRPPVVTVNAQDQWHEEDNHILKWNRWFKVVFAPWAPPSKGRGVEFEVLRSGIRHISQNS